MVVTDNHVKATRDGFTPTDFFSFDFNGQHRVPLTGNISTGGYLALGSSLPVNDQDFNVRP